MALVQLVAHVALESPAPKVQPSLVRGCDSLLASHEVVGEAGTAKAVTIGLSWPSAVQHHDFGERAPR